MWVSVSAEPFTLSPFLLNLSVLKSRPFRVVYTERPYEDGIVCVVSSRYNLDLACVWMFLQ